MESAGAVMGLKNMEFAPFFNASFQVDSRLSDVETRM